MDKSGELPVTCEHCSATFTLKKGLYVHMRRFHPTENLEVGNKLCGACDRKFSSMNDLHQHIQAVHTEIGLIFKTQHFETYSEFMHFKTLLEKETISHFIRKQSPMHLADGSIVRYFCCHRSGKARIKTEERRRKSVGSNKIGFTCPAMIRVTVSNKDGKTTAEVQYTHYGHTADVESGELHVTCEHCYATFISKKGLYAHIRKFHPTENLAVGNKLCGACDRKFSKINNLHQHIQVVHPEIGLIFKTQHFETYSEFMHFKTRLEKETISYFIIKQSAMHLADGSTVHYFCCHRSGKARIRTAEERRRRGKSLGSNKIGFTCPAMIRATVSNKDGKTTAEVQYTHYGHTADVARLPVAKAKQKKLAIRMEPKVKLQNFPRIYRLKKLQSFASPMKISNTQTPVQQVPDSSSLEHTAMLQLQPITSSPMKSFNTQTLVQQVPDSSSLGHTAMLQLQPRTSSPMKSFNTQTLVQQVPQSSPSLVYYYAPTTSAEPDCTSSENAQTEKVAIKKGSAVETEENKKELLIKFQNILSKCNTEEHINMVEKQLGILETECEAATKRNNLKRNYVYLILKRTR